MASSPNLPHELWQIIFNHALEDEPLLDTTTDLDVLADCEWSNVCGMWWLREPRDIICRRQRESYTVKKVS